ncbi:hypothetical protein J5690_03780 [bacterium]|nr:hypothetical protein [bacterium]
MKKFCIVLALFTMFLFVGCGSDKDENDTVADTDSVTDTDSAADTDSGDSIPEPPDTSDSGESADNGDSADDTEVTDCAETQDDTETPDENETPDEADSEDGDEIQDEDETQDEGENKDEDEVQDENETPNDEDSENDEDADSANDEDQIVVVNPCEGVSCGNGGVCTAENGSAVCNCPDGFYGNGTACAAITSQKPGWIGVQWPFTISASVGAEDFSTLTVFGRIYVEGVTGCPLSDHPQQSSWIAQLGYKPGTGSAEYPVVAGTWKWINAGFNDAFTCDDGNQNHEYMASFPTSEAGNFIYIFRFSLDGGATWWYADKGIGPENSDLPRPDFITSETNYPGKATIN